MDFRKLFAETIGTMLLVFFGVGVATLSFGFKLAGASPSAGVVATALAFGLVMMIMAYAIGSISGAHINPAVFSPARLWPGSDLRAGAAGKIAQAADIRPVNAGASVPVPRKSAHW